MNNENISIFNSPIFQQIKTISVFSNISECSFFFHHFRFFQQYDRNIILPTCRLRIRESTSWTQLYWSTLTGKLWCYTEYVERVHIRLIYKNSIFIFWKKYLLQYFYCYCSSVNSEHFSHMSFSDQTHAGTGKCWRKFWTHQIIFVFRFTFVSSRKIYESFLRVNAEWTWKKC